jgi:hypothetical protein
MSLELTVDEIVETLKRSTLTTVLVEGKDDVMIYRWLEEEIGIHKASFMPCGGRKNLLQIYDRRSEFPSSKVIYVADKDSFIYTNIPTCYNNIIWTHGYSIENDLYYGKEIEKLLSINERAIFEKSLNSFIRYYAHEVEKIFRGEDNYNLRHHPQHIICTVTNEVTTAFLTEINFVEPQPETVNLILSNYDVMLRGKSLVALLTRILSNSKRKIKHSKATLLEHCYRSYRNERFSELLQRINISIIT